MASGAGATSQPVALRPAERGAAPTSHLVVELVASERLCTSALRSPLEEEQGAYRGEGTEGPIPVGEEEEEAASVGMTEESEELGAETVFDPEDVELNDALLMIEGWLTAHLHTTDPGTGGDAKKNTGEGEEEEEAPSAVDARAMETAEAPPDRSDELRNRRHAADYYES